MTGRVSTLASVTPYLQQGSKQASKQACVRGRASGQAGTAGGSFLHISNGLAIHPSIASYTSSTSRPFASLFSSLAHHPQLLSASTAPT